MIDEHAATELEVYINNDGDLYRRMTTLILKNLVAKKARGQYRHDLAVKAFSYLTEAGAKKYAQGFDQPWHKMFDAQTRKRTAEELTRDFEAEHALGNYDALLPKKYQKQEKPGGPSSKRTPSHAAKKKPAPQSDRLRAIEARRRALTAQDIRRREQDIRDFRSFLRSASDQQVQGIYEKEQGAGRDEYAELASAEAARRGFSINESGGGGHYGHARKKHPAELNREIKHALSSYRGRW